jgi:hypothetical protein
VVGEHVEASLPVRGHLSVIHAYHLYHGAERIVGINLFEDNVAIGGQTNDDFANDGCNVTTENGSECVGLQPQ